MKIVTVVGARPQFIKAAIVSREIKLYNESLLYEKHIREIIVHTGQHYDYNMSKIFFSEMQSLKPEYQLYNGGMSHAEMTGTTLMQIERILLQEKPDIVLVYGDTNSTLAAALAAAKLHIAVAHVEAGLRSFNMEMPEEINRILTDRVSSWLFCPTLNAMKNLVDEGYRNFSVYMNLVGDVMYDAIALYEKKARPTERISLLLENYKAFYLATFHRAENTDAPERLFEIIEALDFISRNIPVIMPVHPRTQKALVRFGIHPKNIILIDPVGYFDMLILLKETAGVFTDSGGLQKEAYFFHKRCVILRNETEWVEFVRTKAHILAGADKEKIIAAERELQYSDCDFSFNLFGNGDAGAKIVRILANGIK